MTRTPDVADALTISLQLSGSLSSLADPQSSLSSAVRGAIQQDVRSLLTKFGIPGEPIVTISAKGADVAEGDRVVRLIVDGRLARYPDELLQHAYCYVNEKLLDLDATPASIQGWLKACSERAPDTDSDRLVVEFLRLTCVKILERDPAILLGLPQAASYAAALEGWPPAYGIEWLLSCLRQVLDLRISIARQQVVADVIAKIPPDGNATSAVVEELITALRRDSVDIHIDKPSLRELTTAWAVDGPTMFRFLRDELFEELGFPVPRFRFVVVDNLKPGSFAFRVNDFVSLPLFGLGPGQLMVNDTVERLRPGFEAVPTANPATGQPNALIDAASDQRAQQRGLTTWNQIGYLMLCLAEFLRQGAWCTADRAGVQRQLQKLDDVAFPTLVRMARSRRTDDEITRLIRALVRDRVSVQNFRAILESLLDEDLEVDRKEADSAQEAELTNLVEAVRIALGPAIAHKAARSTSTVVVYLVDAEIERVTAEPAALLGEHGDSILRAFRSELAHLPPTAQVPSLLTVSECRAALQRLVSAEFPRISVIAHEELPPGINVQPIARVGL